MYQIGDIVILNESMRRLFEETGPHLIIGHKGSEYLVLTKNGWDLSDSDKQEYSVDGKYLRQSVWLVSLGSISSIAQKEFAETKCKACGLVCVWVLLDSYGQFVCASCKKSGQMAAKIYFN